MVFSRDKFLVEPTTVIAVVKALGALYGKLKDQRERAQILSLLREINSKIDTVIAKQDQIIDEIRALSIQFRADLRNEIINRLQGSLNSYRSQLNIKTATIDIQPRKASLAEISVLADPVEKLSFDLLHYGPPAFSGALSSALLLHSIFKLQRDLGANLAAVNAREWAYLNEWEKVFSSWYDPANLFGIARASADLTEKRAQLEKFVRDYPRRISYGWNFTGGYSENNNYRYEIWQLSDLVIEGDLKVGFSDHIEVLNTNLRNQTWIRGGDGQGGGGGGGGRGKNLTEAEFWASLSPSEKWMQDYDPQDPFRIPGISVSHEVINPSSTYHEASKAAFGPDSSKLLPVNAPETQVLQAKRLEWLELVPRETLMRELSSIIDETRRMFKGKMANLRS